MARDAMTGALGVAVQSHYFSAGSVVPWAEAGIGAVATQAMGEPAYGALGLELMRGGKSAREALRALVAGDAGEATRQVAMIDARGGVAAHTGARCIAQAGHRTGEGVSAQANMMERDTVPDAMLAAYASTSGDLAARMLAALDAAEAEGGDIRGRQSAAILVVSGDPAGRPWWATREMELRVEDHADPLSELRRLVALKRAYRASDDGFEQMLQGDVPGGLAAMEQAHAAAPENAELAFWYALALARTEPDRARALLAEVRRGEPRWGELLRRLPAAGLFPDDRALIERLLAD
ncbi:MAG TPA: DUF1028 domain-containing protein [Steroidobacteraceae bacterium]|nr:DUF1028 domain-containing protein [Steroidobacteraceae bacterium]